MWLMAGAVFVGCKLATLAEVAEAQRLSGRSSFAYVFAWPGLDARSFLMGDDRTAGRPRGGEWGFVFVNTMFGAAMFWGVARFLPIENNLAIGWTGMIGLIFVLHFGLLHAAALSWRATGMSVEPIMDWPIRATSLAEF